MDEHRIAADRLRHAGKRYTSTRRALVRAFSALRRPVTIAQLLHQDHRLAQSSVYRNLAVLEAAGVVRRVASADRVTRFELDGHLQHHLVCRDCGEVAAVTLPADLDADLETAANRISDRTGFEVDRHQVDLLGRCRACARPPAPAGAASR